MSTTDVQYQIGQLDVDIPFFAPDAVMIRGYGCESLNPVPVVGGNRTSSSADSAASPISDLQYLVTNDLKSTKADKVVLAVSWYNTLGGNSVSPVILSYETGFNPTFAGVDGVVLPAGSQLFPTISDGPFIAGAQYLQGQGYSVGICPMVGLTDSTYTFIVDRGRQNWIGVSQNPFTVFVLQYVFMVQHYVNLCVANNINPWIFYIGYGMWDLAYNTPSIYFRQWATMLVSLAEYVSSYLPNTLVTYAADLDEYFGTYNYPPPTQFRLDVLWSSPLIDLVGVNWFAPLNLTYLNDPIRLTAGVIGNEEFSFLLSGYSTRDFNNTDRFVTNSHQAGKTGIPRLPISPTQGMKNIEDFLSLGHYVPRTVGVVSSPTPFPGNLASLNAGSVLGTASVASDLPFVGSGGLFPFPADPTAVYLDVDLGQTVSIALSSDFVTPSSFTFAFNYDVSEFGTSGSFTLAEFDYGLALYYSGGNLTVSVPVNAGLPIVYPITSAALGQVKIQITATQAQIFIDTGLATTLTNTFIFPNPSEHLVIGDGTWKGKVSFVSINVGAGGLNYGSHYYFEEAYAGTRTAWIPGSKGFMATALGYPSISYGCVEPSTQIFLELVGGPTIGGPFPPWFADSALYTNATFLNNPYVVGNIQGPYGSTFIVDEQHQAICVSVAVARLRIAGAVHCVSYYFDTRSKAGAEIQVTGKYRFDDALAFRYSHAQNSKEIIRFSGSDLVQALELPTVDQLLGLSTIPSPEKSPMFILSTPASFPGGTPPPER